MLYVKVIKDGNEYRFRKLGEDCYYAFEGFEETVDMFGQVYWKSMGEFTKRSFDSFCGYRGYTLLRSVEKV